MSEFQRTPHPFKIGMRFLSGHYVYEVERLTEKRAYVVRITNTPIHHSNYGEGTNLCGNQRSTGLYVETDRWTEARQNRLVIVPREGDDELVLRVNKAIRRALPHAERIAALTLEIQSEKEKQRKAVVDTMTAPPLKAVS